MNHSFPLILKLAATAAAGTTALLSICRNKRNAALHSLRRNILHTLLHLPGGVDGAAAPPTILVLGFRGHGKREFINTACRALAGEEGPMVIRLDTAPGWFPPATATRLAVRVATAAGYNCGGWAEEKEDEVGVEGVEVNFIDAPQLPELEAVTPAHIEDALDAAAAGAGGAVSEEALPPGCVVVVLKCSRQARERHLAVQRLIEIADVVRNRGLHILVALTHKKSLRSCKEEELKFEVACRALTDCVYFIENYTAKSSTECRAPTAVKNDFNTDYTALAIIRQCIEFVAQHRKQSTRKKINLATNVDEND